MQLRMKFGDKFESYRVRIQKESQYLIYNKKNLLLYCRKFSPFVVVIIISLIFMTNSVSRRNTGCNKSH